MSYGVNAPFGLKSLSSITGGVWTERTTDYQIYTNPTLGTGSYNTNIYQGDPVIFSGVAANAGTIALYVPGFTDAAPSTYATTPILGVFVSCRYYDINGNFVERNYWPAGTNVMPGSRIMATVSDDPNTVYEVQVSTHVNAANNAFVANPVFPNTNATANLEGSFGSNFALNVGGGTNFNTVPNAVGGTYTNNPASGSTIYGSAYYLDVSSTSATGVTHDYDKRVATLPLKVIGFSNNIKNIPAPGLTMTTTPFLNVRVMINNHVYGHNVAGTTLA